MHNCQYDQDFNSKFHEKLQSMITIIIITELQGQLIMKEKELYLCQIRKAKGYYIL